MAAASAAADRLGEPGGNAGRAHRRRVDARVLGVPVRDELVSARDRVLVAEAGAAQRRRSAQWTTSSSSKRAGTPVAAERLEDERLDPVVAQRLVAAGERAQVLDARDLEPDEVGGVVRDALRVRVREAHAHRRREGEAVHRRQYLDMSVERLAELMRERRPCVVLTGAGISTESGIPDFRSAEGIWATYDPFEVAHIDAFRRDPVRVWEFYALRLDALARRRAERRAPGARASSRSAARARRRDAERRRAAPSAPARRRSSRCTARCARRECVHCGVRVPMAEAVAQLPLPPCPECGEVLKPGVVMFGELLPAAAIERAQQLAAEARLLLVVGSSLEVYPVAGLPEETLAAGGTLAIVNRGGTPWDSRAELVIDAGAGETLRALAPHSVWSS